MTTSNEVMPYLVVKGAREALDFYKVAFGAEEQFALIDPADGRVGHAEFRIGGTTMMIADEYPDFGALSPDTLGGSPVKFEVSVENVDAAFAHVLSLGAVEVRPVKDQFFGYRSGTLIDPFGHSWTLSMRLEDVSPQEMQRRWNESMAG
ncbi:MAG: VOC family protein [Sphingomonadaceae bacterium]|nr:VOC family protein [Sphingomonadaceae bacterium]